LRARRSGGSSPRTTRSRGTSTGAPGRRTRSELRLVASIALVCAAGVIAGAASPASAPVAPRPTIVVKKIPFGAKRRAETATYAQRHYGIRTWRLANPRVIVHHYTASNTFAPAFNTFAADVPDSELGELPGVCSHFVIDRDGAIYQLVRLDTICRHTVGLNWTSFGIEHVGTSAAQILANRKQLSASLSLTLWLMSTYGIQLRNVIGHNESVTSPYHRERYRAWRCQTHGDWRRAEMRPYRAALARLARKHRVPLGPAARPVTARC